MKKVLLFALLTLTNICFSQEKKEEIKKEEVKEKAELKNNRISFIVGIGASVIATDLYQNPAINLANNNVIIEESQNLKTNVSLGIVYTPYKTKIKYVDGREEIVPKGISFATFINPIALTSATENQSFFNMTDFGVGIGYKFAEKVMIMATMEWLSVRQPRQWFITEFEGNNKAFLINESPQLSFDLTDNNIFETKIATTFGFKICYTFDIIKNFKETN